MPSSDAPCTASAEATLANVWRTCASSPPSTTLPASSKPPWPAVNTRSPAATDCEYCTLSAHANGGRPGTISMAGIVSAMHVWDATDYRANSRAQLALAQEFLTRIAIPPDARVLDIGCGDGKVTALIRAASVTGCDRSAAMVALAAREHPECTFV